MNEFIKVEDGKVTINLDAVREHLKKEAPDLSRSGEDAEEGDNASSALVSVRRLFYGTPLEDLISEVIGVCDSIGTLADENDAAIAAGEGEEGD